MKRSGFQLQQKKYKGRGYSQYLNSLFILYHNGMVPEDSRWWVSFGVGAFCVASCVGNVFVLKRFAASFRFKDPPQQPFTAAAGEAFQSSSSAGRRERKKAIPHTRSSLPASVCEDLRLLRLPMRTPTSNQLKEAYRREALLHHPDRYAADNNQFRERKARQFDSATGAYKRLLRFSSPS